LRNTSNHKFSLSNPVIVPWVFMMPFLGVYVLFLVYPFLKGIWISLHDWNLLAVTFNPDAKEYVGFKNYIKVLWGKDIGWSAFQRPVIQVAFLLTSAFAVWFHFKGRIPLARMILIVAIASLFFVLLGFSPEEGGRWYDRRFWPTVMNTITFSFFAVPGVTFTALVLAAMLNRETRAMSVYRTVFFLSQVLSVTVVTLIWQIIFSPRQGLIANVIGLFGGSPIYWLTDEGFAMAAIVITTVWWSLGIAMMLFLAGLQDISKEIYEAAHLDGARGVKGFFYITLPNLRRVMLLVIVLQITLHFQVFGQSHLMTKGGPNDSTQVLVRYIYQTAFRDSELGRASAMAVFLFVIMAVFAVMQFAISRGNE